MKSYKDILLATGTTEIIEHETEDVIELIETVIAITDGVTLKVFNGEVADLDFGEGQHLEFKFNEEIAAAFVNIDTITPVELLTTIARHIGVSI